MSATGLDVRTCVRDVALLVDMARPAPETVDTCLRVCPGLARLRLVVRIPRVWPSVALTEVPYEVMREHLDAAAAEHVLAMLDSVPPDVSCSASAQRGSLLQALHAHVGQGAPPELVAVASGRGFAAAHELRRLIRRSPLPVLVLSQSAR